MERGEKGRSRLRVKKRVSVDWLMRDSGVGRRREGRWLVYGW